MVIQKKSAQTGQNKRATDVVIWRNLLIVLFAPAQSTRAAFQAPLFPE
jgi:hypothetical protein